MQARFTCIAIVSMLFTFTAAATAQNSFDSAEYPFDHDMGGWVDEENGLVWGYNTACVSDVLNSDHISAELYAANYAAQLQAFAEKNEARGDALVAEGDAALAAGNLEEAAFLYWYSDQCYAQALALYSAAGVAADFEGWRLPTLDEIQTAYSRGLFTFPRNPTLDPNNYNPLFDPRTTNAYFNTFRATSTMRGKNFAYRFVPSDGYSEAVSITAIGNMPIVVRSLNPNSGGGGHGKNK